MGTSWIRADVIQFHLFLGSTTLTLEEHGLRVSTFRTCMILGSERKRKRERKAEIKKERQKERKKESKGGKKEGRKRGRKKERKEERKTGRK